MPRFSVPQFIEEKAKIVGPLTIVQFLYVGAGAGIAVLVFYTVENAFVKFAVSALAVGLGATLAFTKVNGQSLPRVLAAALLFWQRPSTYVWERELPSQTIDATSVERINALRRSMRLEERIKSLATKVTTGIAAFTGGEEKKAQAPKYQTVRFLTGEERQVKRVDY